MGGHTLLLNVTLKIGIVAKIRYLFFLPDLQHQTDSASLFSALAKAPFRCRHIDVNVHVSDVPTRRKRSVV